MPACTLCEHQQPDGEGCDVCGQPFAPAARRPVPITPLEGLEATHHEAVPEPREALSDLEPTAAAPVEVVEPPLDALEATAHAAGGEPALDPFDLVGLELEPTLAEAVPDGPRGPLVCRYCRTPAVGWERLCGRCGMRMPVPRATPRASAEARRCGDCGTLLTGGPVCRACGARGPTA